MRYIKHILALIMCIMTTEAGLPGATIQFNQQELQREKIFKKTGTDIIQIELKQKPNSSCLYFTPIPRGNEYCVTEEEAKQLIDLLTKYRTQGTQGTVGIKNGPKFTQANIGVGVNSAQRNQKILLFMDESPVPQSR